MSAKARQLVDGREVDGPEDLQTVVPILKTMEVSAGPDEDEDLMDKPRSICARLKVNKTLLPVKMHFLWRTMGCAPLGMFVTLIMRQRGLSPEGIGLIHTAIRAISVILGTLLITLTDFLKAHRLVFYISTLITPFALSGVYWAPHVGPPPGTMATVQGVFIANSTGDLSLINETKKDGVSKIPDVILSTPAINPLAKNESVEYNISDNRRVIANPSLLNETSMKQVNLKVEEKNAKGDQEASIPQLLQMSGFWFIFFCVFFINTSFFVSNNLTDSICYYLLGKNGHLYGQQRLFGTIAWGFCALAAGSLIDLYSIGLPERDYFPSFILVVIFTTLDLFILFRLQVGSGEEQRSVSSKEFLRVMIDRKNFPFLLTVIVLSITMSIFGIYRLLLVEDVANTWDPNFKALKTLQGLVVAMQCFVGEIPVFIFAGDIILKVEITWSLVIVIGSHSLRFLLYYPVTNPWFFLPIEVLHGFQYGLYKSALTFQAAKLAPEGTTATMLAVIKALQYAGSSLAGVTGGFLWMWLGGPGTFLATGLFLVLYGVFYLVISFVAPCCSLKKQTLEITPPTEAKSSLAPSLPNGCNRDE